MSQRRYELTDFELSIIAPLLPNKPRFSRWLYRFRNVVKRFFNRIKHCRAIATRYEKHDQSYRALVKLAAIRLWIGNY